MTTLKNTTKAGQAIINDYNRTIRNGRQNIWQAYARPSHRKVSTYEEIVKRASETEGYNHDLSVCGANSSFYSTVYSFTDEAGKTFIVKDTHTNTYIVEKGEN